MKYELVRIARCFLIVAVVFQFLAILESESASEKIRLIVRGDDMGSSRTANLACIEAYQNGVMTSVEVMAPTPWFPEAVRLLKDNSGLDVGVHLTLTSEWDNLKWRPLTDAPSLTDEDGYFFPMIWPNQNYPKTRAITGANWKIEEIEKELRAQIELARKHIKQVSHLTGHMGITSIGGEVKDLVDRLAAEYGLKVNLTGVQSAGGYGGPKGTPEEKIASFGNTLRNLTPGTYLFIDHPGRNTIEMQGIHHIGYEDVAIDREGVTAAWTSEEIKRIIENRGIELISYADLVH